MIGHYAEQARKRWAQLTSDGCQRMRQKLQEDDMGLVGELWQLMRERKKWWLLPVIVVMLVVGTLLIFAQGSALAPFIYTIF